MSSTQGKTQPFSLEFSTVSNIYQHLNLESVTYIHASRKHSCAANFKRYFDFDNLFFDQRVVVLLNCIRFVFYNLFCRHTVLSIQKLPSPCPIGTDPERVMPEALSMLSLSDCLSQRYVTTHTPI